MYEHDTEIQIYNKYSGKSEEELENIIEQINQFENLHINKEAHYQQKTMNSMMVNGSYMHYTQN